MRMSQATVNALYWQRWKKEFIANLDKNEGRCSLTTTASWVVKLACLILFNRGYVYDVQKFPGGVTKIVSTGEKAKSPAPPDFDIWWQNEGSRIRPNESADGETHTCRVAAIAWENGAYKKGHEADKEILRLRKALETIRDVACGESQCKSAAVCALAARTVATEGIG